MKRYRYGNPQANTIFQRARPVLVMFAGWNILGILGWKLFNSAMKKDDPKWTNRSDVERIAALTGNNPEYVKKYKYSLSQEKEDS